MRARRKTVIFTKRLGKYSQTFVRRDIEFVNKGQTVVVCRYRMEDCNWIPTDRVLILSNYPRFLWGWTIWVFCLKHRVSFAVVEFLDWACDMQPYLRFMRMPYLALGHGYDVSRYIQSKVGYVDDLKRLSSARAIILPSEFLKSKLVAATDFTTDFVSVVPYGVVLEEFSDVDTPNKSGSFVFIGRFVEKKGPLLVLQSFLAAKPLNHGYTLRMGGDGPMLEACQDYVRENGIEENVHFLGVLTPQQVKRELSAARALVQHSITDSNGDTEGLPVVLQEALAMATPVISTEHSGIPEIVGNGVEGYLVPEQDTDAMARMFVKIAELSEDDYAAMAQRCREKAEQKFSYFNRLTLIQSYIDAR